MKVFIDPGTKPDKANGGIQRLLDELWLKLPLFGITPTANLNEAELINNHGTAMLERVGVPMVSSCHGLYWKGYKWPGWGNDANERVVEAMRRAQAVTAPSRWVAQAISYGMLVKPTVIYHGVDSDAWRHNLDNHGYVYWGKARADAVSDPAPVGKLAAMMPDIKFVSTIAPLPGPKLSNLHVCGIAPYEQMKPVIQQAGVYLATTRETFGIQTLEALASGVPVVGWRYGGQAEIIMEDETGYLVEYGDWDALAAAIRKALAERQRLSANAIADAIIRWEWKDKIAQYADLFWQTAKGFYAPRPKVSVIITCHNLGQYLLTALQSVYTQSITDWECLIVDDASTDNTATIGQAWAKNDTRYRYLPTPSNLKLSAARNYGIGHSAGRYLIMLDADDMLAPRALEVLSTALDMDSSIHIASGHLELVNHLGQEQRRPDEWPFRQFDWRGQMAHLNQMPYASMMRREVMERSGGYRVRDWRAEDAAMWGRVTSYGFRARKVTDEAVLIYRMRSDSKSSQEASTHEDRDGNWTRDWPWSLASTARAGIEAVKHDRVPHAAIVPFGAQGPVPKGLPFWSVRHRQHPLISVIIPVGPGHERYVIDALDSLQAQTFVEWEAIVVNDTGQAWPNGIPGAPYARIVTEGTHNIAYARNAGLAAARAPLCLFLDADDYLLPYALQTMVRAFVESGGKYIYSDYLEETADHKQTLGHTYDFDHGPHKGWLGNTIEHEGRPVNIGLHGVVALLCTEDARMVSGFDPSWRGWEEWAFFIELTIRGVCGVRIPEPLYVYRQHTGKRRQESKDRIDELQAELDRRYTKYALGQEPIMACGCGNAGNAINDAKRYMDSEPAVLSVADEQQAPPSLYQTVKYVGSQVGDQTYTGNVSGETHRFGANANSRFRLVHKDDIPRFLLMGVFEVVIPPAPAPVMVDEPIMPEYIPEESAEYTARLVDAPEPPPAHWDGPLIEPSESHELTAMLAPAAEPPSAPKRKGGRPRKNYGTQNLGE